MELDEPPGERQSEPRPLVSRERPVAPLAELLEDQLRWSAGAIPGPVSLTATSTDPRPDARAIVDAAAGRRELHRVGQQVEDDLA